MTNLLLWMISVTTIATASGLTIDVDGPISGPCSLCPEGAPGPRGPPGDIGLPGRDGRDGRDASCNSQLSGMPSPVDQTNDGSSENTSGGNTVINVNSSGAVYIRWGRDVCVDGSELVYAGTAAGAHYQHTGSGSNYLCMPPDPIYDEHQSGGSRGLLYSAEYETSNAIGRLQGIHDHTPKCAVCRAPSGRSTKLMIPARNECPSDEWRLEYSGYLMSAYHGHKRTEFVCFDHDMEAEPSTAGNENGALFYMVTAACVAGSGLPCGPYIDGQELTCALCTI
ncbi:short-chain collagen C4-like [Lytechinus variegatus]|uniref:short-chain collagen C4-like n=1 Tax=Lytechinus variegatus TaxID=7654 RepID=UPI001BB1FB58|nr:short-chain collagen C4-like [Lytechinus variegatus]